MRVDNRLNILFLSGWYPSRSHRTLGNFVQRHAEAVATLHHVHVLYLTHDPNLPVSFEIEHSTEQSVQSTIVYYRKSTLPFLAQWRALQHGIRELESRGEFNFDLVHHNVTWPAGWQALLLHKKYKLPYIITEHWTGFDLSERQHPGKIAQWLSKKTVHNAEVVCPVTENLAAIMQQFGLKGQYRVVPNVVDTSLFHPVKNESATCRFLHVSSLDENQKNITGILRSWKKATENSANIHLAIGGDGPWQTVRDYANELNIPAETISFFGELPWSGIADLMQQSHCLLLFSNYENLPCVIVESLASGMAVISSDVGGIREHIHNEMGYLISRRDEDALTEAICRFANERSKFDTAMLSQYATDHFSIPSIARQFNEVYHLALKQYRNQ
jgi:glycosyltransferase involved in cell wall biosynthesis